jgi:protein-disulfide isomerase
LLTKKTHDILTAAMKNLPLLIGTLLGTLLLVIGVALFFGRSQEPKTVDADQLRANARHVLTASPSDAEATPSATPADPSEATDDAEETESAEPKKVVTLVEFSDLQCPACRAAAPIRDAVLNAHPGQVEFVFRHYPLTTIHGNALLAAHAAEASAAFDKFWEYHDNLFTTQDQWSDLSTDQAREKFIEYAVELGIEKDAFTKELNSDTVKSAVQSDINLGDEVKVSATPTFFVDGKQVPASDVEQIVSDLLGS